MSKETKKLDNWFSEHFEIQFVGGDKKENKKLRKKITKKLKEDIIKGDKQMIFGTFFHKMMGYKPVSKNHSNLGKDGCIKLYCPHCMHNETYYGLYWSAFKCTNCKEFVDKTDFLWKEKK